MFGRLLWLSWDLVPTHNACYHKHKRSLIIKHLALFTIRNASSQNICYFLPPAGYHSKFVFNWHLRPIETGVPPCVWAKCHADRWTSVLVCWRASFHVAYKSEWLHFPLQIVNLKILKGLSCLRWKGCTSAFQLQDWRVGKNIAAVWNRCLALVNRGCCSEGGLSSSPSSISSPQGTLWLFSDIISLAKPSFLRNTSAEYRNLICPASHIGVCL